MAFVRGVSAGVILAGLASCGDGSPAAPSPVGQTESLTAPVPGYHLAWQDEFDGGAMDSSKWTAQSGVRRAATNTPAAVSVAGGALSITTYTEDGTHFTGFIDTAGKYEATYGYFEARIKFEPTAGEWGAFWLQSPTMGNPVGNPAAAGTEIDMAEHRARDTSMSGPSGALGIRPRGLIAGVTSTRLGRPG